MLLRRVAKVYAAGMCLKIEAGFLKNSKGPSECDCDGVGLAEANARNAGAPLLPPCIFHIQSSLSLQKQVEQIARFLLGTKKFGHLFQHFKVLQKRVRNDRAFPRRDLAEDRKELDEAVAIMKKGWGSFWIEKGMDRTGLQQLVTVLWGESARAIRSRDQLMQLMYRDYLTFPIGGLLVGSCPLRHISLVCHPRE